MKKVTIHYIRSVNDKSIYVHTNNLTREHRREYLKYIEETYKDVSISKAAYTISFGYDKVGVQYIKEVCKYLHIWDYKNKYPRAVQILSRICYPKKRDTWGREVELKQNYIKNISLRKGELIKRFNGLVKKYSNDESKIDELLLAILESPERLNLEEINLLKSKTPKNTSLYNYYDNIILFLSICKDEEHHEK